MDEWSLYAKNGSDDGVLDGSWIRSVTYRSYEINLSVLSLVYYSERYIVISFLLSVVLDSCIVALDSLVDSIGMSMLRDADCFIGFLSKINSIRECFVGSFRHNKVIIKSIELLIIY